MNNESNGQNFNNGMGMQGNVSGVQAPNIGVANGLTSSNNTGGTIVNENTPVIPAPSLDGTVQNVNQVSSQMAEPAVMENQVPNQTVEPVNLMADFSQVIATTPEVKVQTEPAPIGGMAQTISTESVMEDVQPEVVQAPVLNEEVTTNNIETKTADVNIIASETVSTPMVENNNEIVNHQVAENVTKLEEKKKKTNNWVFILVLFAIVAIFVLVLPLLVSIFGYN